MLYRIAIFSKYRDTLIYRYVSHITKKISPELHRLVTHFQLHKCSSYCRRKKRYRNGYITYCKFGFPREVVDETVLNNVEDQGKKFTICNAPQRKREIMITTLSSCICGNQTLMYSMLLMLAQPQRIMSLATSQRLRRATSNKFTRRIN